MSSDLYEDPHDWQEIAREEPDCSLCRFFDPELYSHGARGECRRHAPRLGDMVEQNENIRWAAWPVVQSEEWCGEYAPLQGMQLRLRLERYNAEWRRKHPPKRLPMISADPQA